MDDVTINRDLASVTQNMILLVPADISRGTYAIKLGSQ